eukprot:1168944_1
MDLLVRGLHQQMSGCTSKCRDLVVRIVSDFLSFREGQQFTKTCRLFRKMKVKIDNREARRQNQRTEELNALFDPQRIEEFGNITSDDDICDCDDCDDCRAK